MLNGAVKLNLKLYGQLLRKRAFNLYDSLETYTNLQSEDNAYLIRI